MAFLPVRVRTDINVSTTGRTRASERNPAHNWTFPRFHLFGVYVYCSYMSDVMGGVLERMILTYSKCDHDGCSVVFLQQFYIPPKLFL
jgi:hypothetical protein